MKDLIRKIFHRAGFDIVRYGRTPAERARLIDSKGISPKNFEFLKMLTIHEIDLILDIGANTGQWAGSIFEGGYEGRIVSFEPLSSAHAALLERSRSNGRWTVAERRAIGAEDREIEINIAGNSESSSILPMLSAHTDAAPRAKYTGSEKVKMLKLDTVAPGYLGNAKAPFIKLDVQGYEREVLRGGGTVMPQIRGMQLESSLIPLYQGELLFRETLETMRGLGFSLWRVSPGFWDYRTGRTLQVNCVFFREKSIEQRA